MWPDRVSNPGPLALGQMRYKGSCIIVTGYMFAYLYYRPIRSYTKWLFVENSVVNMNSNGK